MATASFNDEPTINASLGSEPTINASLPNINYIPGYKIAEEERRANEVIRQANEETRQTNEASRIALYNDMEYKLQTDYFKGEKGDKGDTGSQGVPGKDFSIYKTYSSIASMNADAANVPEGEFVMIASTPEDEDNSKLYVKNSSGTFTYISDLSGATGIQGPQGPAGPTYDDTEIREELYGDANVSGTGSDITLNDTYNSKLKVDLKGNTYQDSYTGKNLFDTSNISLNTMSGLTSSIKDATLKLNGTNSSQGYLIPNNSNTGITLPTGTYTFSAKILKGTSNVSDTSYNLAIYIKKYTSNSQILYLSYKQAYSSSSKTVSSQFTLTEATQIGFEVFTNGSITYNNIEIGIQIEKNTTATSYEPYVGGTPSPNPTYPQNIEVVTGYNNITISDGTNSQSYEVNLGKNLYDYANTNITYDINTIVQKNSDNVVITSTDSYARAKTTLNTTIGVQYTISCKYINNNGQSIKIGVYSSNNSTLLAQTDVVTSTTGTFNLTFTATETSHVLRLYVNATSSSSVSGSVTYSEIQLEQGNTASSYSAYKIPIEMCKIGTYQDYIYKENDTWYIHKEIGKVVLDGSESISLDSSSLDDVNRYRLYYGTITLQAITSSSNGMTNQLQISNSYSGTNEHFYTYNVSGTSSFYMFYNRSRIADLAALKTYLANNNLIIYGILATPTNTEITDTELINELNALESANSYTGVTNITAEYISGNQPFIMDINTLKNNINGKFADLYQKYNSLLESIGS